MYCDSEYILFEYICTNKTINIYFLKRIYEKHFSIINNIFKLFEFKQIRKENAQRGFYVSDGADILPPDTSELCVYDTSSEEWIFKLLTDVESYIIKELNVTVCHGACLAKNEYALLIMGQRKAGKSTLTHYLVKNGWTLIDDDCIYFDSDYVLGFGFPLRLRNIVFEDENIFAICLDMDGENRHLVVSQNCCRTFKFRKIMIIFPEYTAGATIEINPISKIELFTQLLKNTRFSASEKKLIKDVTDLMRYANAGYEVKYSSCEEVKFFLMERTKDEEG